MNFFNGLFGREDNVLFFLLIFLVLFCGGFNGIGNIGGIGHNDKGCCCDNTILFFVILFLLLFNNTGVLSDVEKPCC